MPLSSSSTFDQIVAAYADNASYIEDGSVSKCKAFITACLLLLLKLPKRSGTREADTEMNPDLIRSELDKARDWLTANDPDAGGTSEGSAALPNPTNRRTTRLNFNEFGG